MTSARADEAVQVFAASSADVERVARLRSRCYRASYAREADMLAATRADRADFDAGDVLITTRGGRDVATTTSMRGQINLAGSILPCQGIAWVGTTHDARRAGGVASATMRHALDLARDRGDVFSALMPFRATYYEHFGYGLCERRAVWDVPPTLLPKGDASTIRFVEPGDEVEPLADARDRQFSHGRLGHGDVNFPHAAGRGVAHWQTYYRDRGYLFSDVEPSGRVAGWLGCVPFEKDGHGGLDVQHMTFETPAGFMRQLHFLSTLRDQYGVIRLYVPADRPIHLLLAETQLPHRKVEHAHATVQIVARNQVRVLDHVAALETPAWPNASRTGTCVVRVHESEGHATTLRLELRDGRCAATLCDATPDFECADKVWAPLLFGELRASWASSHGLATAATEAAGLLEDLAARPLPFCREYF